MSPLAVEPLVWPQITLDGEPLSVPYDRTADIDGWFGSPTLRTSFTPRGGQPGSYYSPAPMDARVMNLTGRLKAATPGDAQRLVRKIGALCTDDPMALYELRATTDFGTLFTQVQRSSAFQPKIINRTTWDYQVQLTAPDPRLLQLPQPSPVSTLLAQPGAGGVLWDGPSLTQWNGPDGTTGLQWGRPTNTGSVLVDNTDGNAPADLFLTITGPAMNPTVTTVFGRIAYGGTLAAADTLTIDTGSGAVLLNGVNRRNLLTAADFPQIPGGQQLALRFTADLENTTASLTAQWFVSYV